MKAMQFHAIPYNFDNKRVHLMNRWIDSPLENTFLETLEYAEQNNIYSKYYKTIGANLVTVEELKYIEEFGSPISFMERILNEVCWEVLEGKQVDPLEDKRILSLKEHYKILKYSLPFEEGILELLNMFLEKMMEETDFERRDK